MESIKLDLFQEIHVTNEYVSWLNDPEINQYLEARHQKYDYHTLVDYVKELNEDSKCKLFRIVDQINQIHIGNIKIDKIDNYHRTAEFGIMLGEKTYWGKGVATQAIKLALEYSSSVLELRKIVAGCYEANIGSRRAFEKAGFEVEARLRNQFRLNNGELVDGIILSKFLC